MSQTDALLTAFLVTVTLLAVLAILGNWRPRRRHPLVAESVVLQLKDGSAVAGLLTRRAGGFLVLENARLYENGGDVPVDGSAWVPNDEVRWIQHAPYQDRGER